MLEDLSMSWTELTESGEEKKKSEICYEQREVFGFSREEAADLLEGIKLGQGSSGAVACCQLEKAQLWWQIKQEDKLQDGIDKSISFLQQ